MRRALPLILLALAAVAATVVLWPEKESGSPPADERGAGPAAEEPAAGAWQGEDGQEASRALAGGELPVRVVDSGGAAVAAGTLHVSLDGEPRSVAFEGGVAKLPRGRGALAAAAHAGGRWSSWQALAGDALRDAQEMVLQLEEGEAAVDLRVVLDDGSAAPAPRLLLASTDPRADASLPADGWSAGSDGVVQVDGLAPGSYAATVVHEGCARWTAQWTLEADASLERTVTLSRVGSLSGVVHGPRGPLAGARLLLAPAAMARQPFSFLEQFRTYGTEPPAPPDEAVATSGADGAFRFPAVRPGSYLLLVKAPGLLPHVREPEIEIQPGAEAVAGRVELRPGSRVVVRVQDADGAPLSGAQVRWRASSEAVLAQVADIWSEVVESDDDGVALLEPLPGGMLVVEARHPSGAPAEAVAEIPAQGSHEREVVLRMGAGASLAGRVLRAADDAPVEGATLALVRSESLGAGFFGGGAPEVRSGPDGSFRFERQPPGSYLVRASHDDFATALAGPVDLAEGAAAPVVLRLDAGATLEVLARDDDGAPLADATVSLTSSAQRVNEVRTTDAGGNALFERLAAGDYQVSLLGPGFEERAPSGELDIEMRFVSLAGGERRQLEIGGGGAAADVEGVVTRRGEPVEGAMVVAVLTSGARTARTDAEGVYRMEKVPVGEHVLMVQMSAGGVGGGSHYEGLQVPSAAAVRHDIALPGAAVEVVVRDASGGAPVAGLPVSLRPADGSHISGADFGVTDPEGVARFRTVAPGEYVVAAGRATLPMLAGEELSRFAAEQRRIQVPAADRTERIELSLGAAATFRARVADRDGNFLSGAHLYYLDPDGQPLSVLSMTGTNANGVAQLTGLPAGPGRILVRHPVHGVAEFAVDLQAGQLHKREVTLEGGTRLLVEVVDASGAPVAGVLAVALDARGAPLSTTWTMEQSQAVRGAFFQGTPQTLGPLPAGSYTVRLVRPGRPTVEHPVTLDGSPEMRVRLRYDP